MKILNLTATLFLIVLLGLGSCGKTGPAGPQGPQGEQGAPGSQGIAGADGSMIFSGSGSPDAGIGKKGDYYLDKTTGGLYGPKTDAGWGEPFSLKGEKGDKGDSGQDGADGSRILSGTSAPASSVGNPGDYYWNTSNLALYGPKTSTGWGSGIVLRGPKGDKGDKGEKGDPGTANVIYSDWMTFSMTGSGYGAGTGLGYGADNQYYYINMRILDKYITQDIVDHGTVLAYCKLDEELNPFYDAAHPYYVTPLPTSINWSPTVMARMLLKFRTGSVYFFLEKTGGLFIDYPPIQIRYVIIPGGVHARKSLPSPDPKDYKGTCAYYGIPE